MQHSKKKKNIGRKIGTLHAIVSALDRHIESIEKENENE